MGRTSQSCPIKTGPFSSPQAYTNHTPPTNGAHLPERSQAHNQPASSFAKNFKDFWWVPPYQALSILEAGIHVYLFQLGAPEKNVPHRQPLVPY